MAESLLFFSMAGLLIFCSIMVVTRKNPIASAIYLIGSLFLVASFYAFMGADFVAVIQILVYAGAIMVLFLFVIMLLNVEPELLEKHKLPMTEVAVLAVTIFGFALVAFQVFNGSETGVAGQLTLSEIAQNGGNTYAVGLKLFMDYLWPFELASFLILMAIVASIVIAKKDKPSSEVRSK